MKTTLKADNGFFLSTGFYEDPFVVSLRKEFGIKGSLLAIIILTEISENGHSVKFSRNFSEHIVQLLPEVSTNLVKMVVRRMTDGGFLDKSSFVKEKVLTPPEKCFIDSINMLSGSFVSSSAPYYFIRGHKSIVNSEEKHINSEETHVYSEETRNKQNNVLFNDSKPLNNEDYGTSTEARS